MIVTPEILSLLAAAHDLTRAELVPHLGGGDRYKAAMVANAMAIALRAAGASGTDAEQAGLVALYPEHAGASVPELRRRLVADIRAGRLDGVAMLVETVLRPRIAARLKVSHPDYDPTHRCMENKEIPP